MGAPSTEGLTAGCRRPGRGGGGQRPGWTCLLAEASLALTLESRPPETPVCRRGSQRGSQRDTAPPCDPPCARPRPRPRSSPLVPPAAMEEERAAFTALSSLQKGEAKVGPRAVAFVFQKFPLELAFKGRPPRLPAGRWRHWPGLGCPPLLSVPRAALLSCF